MTVSLFERMGGADAVEATVTRFYRKVMADKSLSRFFEEVDMERQMAKQRAFLTYAFGGPPRYQGKGLRAVHAPFVRHGLNSGHFDAITGYLEASLQELELSPELLREVMAIVHGTRSDVLGE